MQPQLSGGRGFTLVEMMIALVVLSISLLGLTGMVATSINGNLQNDVRNLAAGLATETAEMLLAQPIENVIDGGLSPYDNSNVALAPDYRYFPDPLRSLRGRTYPFKVDWTVSEVSNDLREVTLTVQYDFRDSSYRTVSVLYKHRAL